MELSQLISKTISQYQKFKDATTLLNEEITQQKIDDFIKSGAKTCKNASHLSKDYSINKVVIGGTCI